MKNQIEIVIPGKDINYYNSSIREADKLNHRIIKTHLGLIYFIAVFASFLLLVF